MPTRAVPSLLVFAVLAVLAMSGLASQRAGVATAVAPPPIGALSEGSGLPTGPAGLADDLAGFLDTCPTGDPAYSQIRNDFKLRREGALVGDVPCSGPISSLPVSQYTDELIVLQGLRTIYYMDRGRSGHLPWTSGTLYDWMVSKIGGINISSGGSYCCQEIDGETYIVIGQQDDFNRDFDRTWRGISGNIGLYAHETRHVDGFPHVSGCGIPNGCDQTYDETNLSPYGIQWWLNANWLSGNLRVGFSCLDPSEVLDTANWHLSAANSFRDRFVDTKPPELTMPQQPGGPCQQAGDTDCDGLVSSIDAALILQLSAGLIGSLACQGDADVNLDGVANAIDAALILQFSAGLIPYLPPP
jgi:hypothetical protein